MAYLSLVVKGNRHQAAKAAGKRGIPFAFRSETLPAHSSLGVYTVGITGVQHVEDVANWMFEWPVAGSSMPAPDGALLVYSILDQDAQV